MEGLGWGRGQGSVLMGPEPQFHKDRGFWRAAHLEMVKMANFMLHVFCFSTVRKRQENGMAERQRRQRKQIPEEQREFKCDMFKFSKKPWHDTKSVTFAKL